MQNWDSHYFVSVLGKVKVCLVWTAILHLASISNQNHHRHQTEEENNKRINSSERDPYKTQIHPFIHFVHWLDFEAVGLRRSEREVIQYYVLLDFLLLKQCCHQYHFPSYWISQFSKKMWNEGRSMYFE